MEIALVVLIIAAGVGVFWYRERRKPLSTAEIEDAKRRIAALQDRAKTQFFAMPGDERLMADWEYLTASKKPGEELLTFTIFTKDGISRTQTGMADKDVFGLQEQGWRINGQRFTADGLVWQLERPLPTETPRL